MKYDESQHIIASPWKRLLAFVIDLIISRLLIGGINIAMLWYIQHYLQAREDFLDLVPMLVQLGILLQIIAVVLYFSLFEASRLGMTPGKMLFRIRVMPLQHDNLKFLAIMMRNVYKLLPIIFLMCFNAYIGLNHSIELNITQKESFLTAILFVFAFAWYGLIFFTIQKQTCYDRIAGTVTINVSDNYPKLLALSIRNFISSLRKK